MAAIALAKGTLDAVLRIIAAREEKDVAILKLAADSDPEMRAEALVWLKRENARDQARGDRWEGILDRFKFWDRDEGDKP